MGYTLIFAIAKGNQADLFLSLFHLRFAFAVGHSHPAAVESKFLQLQNDFLPVISQCLIKARGFWTHKGDIIFHSGKFTVMGHPGIEAFRLIIKNLDMQTLLAVDFFNQMVERGPLTLLNRSIFVLADTVPLFHQFQYFHKSLPPIRFLYSPLLSGSSFAIETNALQPSCDGNKKSEFPYVQSRKSLRFSYGYERLSLRFGPVSVGIVGLPSPGIGAHLLDSLLCLPAQLPLRLGAV